MQNLVESSREMHICDITPTLYQAPSRLDELATAERRKDEFLAMCHELRSPLAAIQNAFRLMSSENAETAAESSSPHGASDPPNDAARR